MLALPTRAAPKFRWPLTIALFVTLLLPSGQALAQAPDDSSAVDQYVEDVPTGEGSNPVAQPSPKHKPLPTSVQQQVVGQGGEDAQVLEELATSSAYGAPQEDLVQRSTPKKAGGETASVEVDDGASAGGAVAAAGSAVESEGGSRLVGLLVALFVISLGAFAIARLRHTRTTR